MKHIIIPAVLLASALPAMSQERPRSYSVHADVIRALEGLKKLTNAPAAAVVGGSIDFRLPKDESLVRASLDLAFMPGRDNGSIKTDARLVQGSVDALLATPVKGLYGIVGLSVNKYTVKNSGTEVFYKETAPGLTNPQKWAPQYAWATTNAKGLKGGIRLGAEYRITEHLSASALLQATELAGGEYVGAGASFVRMNRGPVNPGWFQAGVRWHF